MMIFDSRKLVVLHLPKSAGTSIRYALDGYGASHASPLPPTTVELPTGGSRPGGGQHLSALQTIALFPRTKDYLFAGVLRNPWDRLVSAWRFHTKRYPSRQRDVPTFADFARLLDRGASWPATYRETQLSYFAGASRRTFLRYERLDEYWPAFCAMNGFQETKLAFSPPDLPHYKQAPDGAVDYRYFYSDWSREMVATRFAVDVEIGGYLF